jgi:hypothetical protein
LKGRFWAIVHPSSTFVQRARSWAWGWWGWRRGEGAMVAH